MNDFSETRYQLECKFEDLLIEMGRITTPKGLPIRVDDLPIIEEFKKMIDGIEWCYLADRVMMIPNPSMEGPNDEE